MNQLDGAAPLNQAYPLRPQVASSHLQIQQPEMVVWIFMGAKQKPKV